MTDRELLELAAKAAGIKAQWDSPERGMMVLTPDGIDTMTWNPLNDDGDALRLAVKLGMKLQSYKQNGLVTAVQANGVNVGIHDAGQKSDWYGDPYIATCRAICHAAAEIGKAMIKVEGAV